MSVLVTAVSARANAWGSVVSNGVVSNGQLSGRDAVPAIDQVLLPLPVTPTVTTAATLGYGVTESQTGEGAHHRVEGTVAAALPVIRDLALSLALDGRYDAHPDTHAAAVALPRLRAIYTRSVGERLQLGAAATFETAASFRFADPVLTGSLLAAWQLERAWWLSGLLGFRFDASAHDASVSSAQRLTAAASDFHALPVGVSALARIGPVALGAELSGELLLGVKAPALLQSPLRAAVVARVPLVAGLTGELLMRVGLSQRPAYARAEPSSPVEPRFVIALGVRAAFEPAPAPRKMAPPAQTRVLGVIEDADGAPLSAATVLVRVGVVQRTVQTSADGSFELTHMPRGPAQLEISADGFLTSTQSAQLDQPEVTVSYHVERRALSAQLRGLVRSFEGTALTAVVRVSHPFTSVTADNDGRFVLELSPGVYQIEIECGGYLTQRRKVRVQENGVTVLNVELLAAPR